ncbi:MAG: DMT family transporter [Gammaproteobacteria bacterium]|nr:DMT family transporter [Gammaproteobacteria bacterium]MDH3449419.1 DMT family transporter [Gammaproteobacteria bacterium]
MKPATAMTTLLEAVAIMAAGKLLFAAQDVIIKEMSGTYPIHEIMTIRGVVAIALLLLLIHFSLNLAALRLHHPGYHLLRGLLMFIAFMAFYIGLAEISLTTATALFFTAPFFITLLSIPLLGERVGARRFLGILAGFVGVLIVLRPDTEQFSPVSLLPVIAAFFYALCQVLVRYARMSAPASIMSLYASISFAVMAPIMGWMLSGADPLAASTPSEKTLALPWSMPESFDLMLLTFTGVTSALGFMFMSYAYKNAQASRLAPFEYVMIVWVTLLSYLVWGEVPDLPSIAGIVIIILSGIYVLHREEAAGEQPIAYTGLTRR